MSPGLHTALTAVFCLVLVVGGAFLLLSVHVDGAREVGLDCGSAVTGVRGAISFDPRDERVEEVARNVAACEAAIGSRRAWAWPVTVVGLLGVALVLFLAKFVWPPVGPWRGRPPKLHR
ncbi:MAG: hypothetical protein HOV94_17070 [Saccharothrix sp.]|nr:hypothetical protein [Saccharothrix sp.]